MVRALFAAFSSWLRFVKIYIVFFTPDFLFVVVMSDSIIKLYAQRIVIVKIIIRLTHSFFYFIIGAMKENEFLTTTQVAEKLGVSLRRVQALIADGRLPSMQIGREHLIKESDVKLVENRTVGRPKKEKPDVPETVKPDAPTVPKESKTLLSVAAAAAFLKCSEKEIIKMKRNGLPTEKGKINEDDLTVINRRLFAR